MAIAFSKKIHHKLAAGVDLQVWHVSGLVAGANNISAPSLGLNYVTIAEFRPMVGITSAGATTVAPMMTTNSGEYVTITCLDNGDAGSIRAYGY